MEGIIPQEEVSKRQTRPQLSVDNKQAAISSLLSVDNRKETLAETLHAGAGDSHRIKTGPKAF
jgi:hypothetical protein